MKPTVRWEEEETDLVTNFFKDVTNPSKRKVIQTSTSFRYLQISSKNFVIKSK